MHQIPLVRYPRWIALAAALLSGCAAGDGLIPVKGRLIVDGKPLTVGSISFRPNAARGNNGLKEPAGLIDRDGYYELYTDCRLGAPAGWYRILVTADDEATRQCLVNEKYGRLETSGLSVEVVRDPAGVAYDLSLSR